MVDSRWWIRDDGFATMDRDRGVPDSEYLTGSY